MKKYTIYILAAMFLPVVAFAADDKDGMYYIGRALAIGLAALGGALGQGKLVSSALEGIARNPGASGSLFTPMILGIAFVESLVIFALIVSFTM